jgi:hypothetical protein
MPEGHAREPVDADVDVRRALLASRNLEVAAARRARADEDGVVAFGHQRLHGIDPAMLEVHAEIEDVVDLFVDHLERQPEARDLRPDHAAGARVLVEHRHVVAERREVARHGERRRAGADAGNAFAVGLGALVDGDPFRDLRVVLVVGGDALQPADRHRLGPRLVLFFGASAAARRLAGTVAGPAEDSGKDVRLPVHHVGVGVASGGDQPDVLGHGRVGRTGPLAIDDLVEVVGVLDVGGLHEAPDSLSATGGSWRGSVLPFMGL